MRLPTNYVEAIKASVAEAFGPSAVVRLFGSRVRDDLRGGDIDLLIETDAINDEWHRGEAGIIDNSFASTTIIKLRNRLVHDYPLQSEAQFDMLTQAYAAVPTLRSAARSARDFIASGDLRD